MRYLLFPIHKLAICLLPWLSAAILALLAALTVLKPIVGAAVVALGFILWCASRIITKPVFAAYIVMWVFPWYNLFRAALYTYYPTLPLFASRFWMEMLLALASVGIITRVVLRRASPVLDRDDLPFLLIVMGDLYALLITTVNHSYFNAVFGVYYSLTPVLCFFALRWCGSTREHLRQLLKLFFASFTLVAIFSLADYCFHPAFMLKIYGTVRTAFFKGNVADIYQTVTTTYLRMQSLMLEENQWGALTGFIALLCIARLSTGVVTTRMRCMLALLLGLSVSCLVLSMSRGAAIGFGAGLIVMILLHKGFRRRVCLITCVLLLTLAGLYAVARTDSRVKLIETRAIVAASQGHESAALGGIKVDYEREQQWRGAINSFKQNPSGIGLGSSGYSALYVKLGDALAADGIYFRVLAEQGIPGTLLWLMGTGLITVSLLRRLKWSRYAGDALLSSVGIALLAELTSLCVHGLTANTFDYSGAFRPGAPQSGSRGRCRVHWSAARASGAWCCRAVPGLRHCRGPKLRPSGAGMRRGSCLQHG